MKNDSEANTELIKLQNELEELEIVPFHFSYVDIGDNFSRYVQLTAQDYCFFYGEVVRYRTYLIKRYRRYLESQQNEDRI